MKARFTDNALLEKEFRGQWHIQYCHKSHESQRDTCGLTCTACNVGHLEKKDQHGRVIATGDVVALQCTTPAIVMDYDDAGIIIPTLNPTVN